jgi:uncharacterized cupredoxin-like copper-binding protein
MKVTVSVLLGMAAFAVPFSVAFAAGDLTQQTPTEIKVRLGDEKNSRRFVPDTIELETGKLYRLVLSNPSSEKHYFSSEGLSQAVFTRKEVFPNAVTEWWFVPVKAGRFGDLKCTVPGHAEAGMVGRITIK